MHHTLPEAIINLKQGAGRLIRDVGDRGVLMLCDPRVISKPYGKRIWQSLPPSSARANRPTSSPSSRTRRRRTPNKAFPRAPHSCRFPAWIVRRTFALARAGSGR
jgi:hypothetical protein